MPAPGAPITLLTDFGTADPFVGVMKGVILGIHPRAVIVDLTHDVPPQDIQAAAYHLANSWRHFPYGTVHVAVVDPGVGSSRRALAVQAEGQQFVAPDNGLLTSILDLDAWRAVEITARHYLASQPSPTFHGRDVFAHAAAHLSRGVPIEYLGAPVANPVRLEPMDPHVAGDVIHARVIHVDRFGNLVLNVGASDLRRAMAVTPSRETRDSGVGLEERRRAAGLLQVHARPETDQDVVSPPGVDSLLPRLSADIGGHHIDLFVTHYAAASGALCFLINSDGRLEIARPGGSAAATIGLSRGAEVTLRVDSSK